MPISQDKIISLLDEYQRNRETLEDLRIQIGKIGDRAAELAQLSGQHHLNEIVVDCLRLSDKPLPTCEQLAVMRYHYHIFARINTKKRLKAKLDRAKEVAAQMGVDDLPKEEPPLDRNAWKKGLTPEQIAVRQVERDAEDAAMEEAWKKDRKG